MLCCTPYIVKTPTQPQLNLTEPKFGFYMKRTWHLHYQQPIHPSTTHHTNSMSAISQLLLARFWPNFKGRFLGLSLTDPNCHDDICPSNICPCDICPYQEYLSCYWSDFDQTLEVGWQGQAKFKARSRQGHGKVKTNSGQDQGKIKAGSWQDQVKVRAR